MYVEKFNSKNRNDIYKLWYDIYYIEMNRNHKYVCHNKKTIIDELEDSSTILVLKNSNKQIIVRQESILLMIIYMSILIFIS